MIENEARTEPQDDGAIVDKQAQRAAFMRIATLITLNGAIGTLAGTWSGIKGTVLLTDVLKLSAGGMATMGIIASIGDYIRPFIGSFADFFPLFGYHRRSYFVLGILIGCVSGLCMGLIRTYTYREVLVLSVVSGVGGAMLMIMADAIMVTIGNKTGTIGVLQSLQQFVPTVLGTILAHLGGYAAQHWSYQTCFLLSVGTSVLVLPLVFLIDEKKVITSKQAHETQEEHEERARKKAEDRRRTSATLKAAAKSVELWAIVGFVFYLIFTPSINNAQFIYQFHYLHFTQQQLGDLGTPGGIGAIIGIVLFGVASRYIRVKPIVWGAWLMDCTTYVILYGIHDYHSAQIVAFLSGVIGTVYTLCLYTLAARACPPGIEGTIYGLVISAIVLAGALGEKVGDSIFDAVGGKHLATMPHAWHESIIIGLLLTLPAVVFIPFLPKWTKSNELLRSPTVHSPEAA